EWYSFTKARYSTLSYPITSPSKVRLPYRGVCANDYLRHHLKVVQVVDGRLAPHWRVSSRKWWQGHSRRSVKSRDTLNLLGLLLHGLGLGLLSLQHLNVIKGSIQLNLLGGELLLQKCKVSIPVVQENITLLNQTLQLANMGIKIPDLLILSDHYLMAGPCRSNDLGHGLGL